MASFVSKLYSSTFVRVLAIFLQFPFSLQIHPLFCDVSYIVHFGKTRERENKGEKKKKKKYALPLQHLPGYVPRRPPQRWAQWALKGATNSPRRTCHYGRQRPQELNGCEDGQDRLFTSLGGRAKSMNIYRMKYVLISKVVFRHKNHS